LELKNTIRFEEIMAILRISLLRYDVKNRKEEKKFKRILLQIIIFWLVDVL
jgi:hypothetical protein